MSDYSTDTDILRDRMADMLAGNEEQFIYVLSSALNQVAADDLIDQGMLADDVDTELVVHNLRLIASAIEHKNVT